MLKPVDEDKQQAAINQLDEVSEEEDFAGL